VLTGGTGSDTANGGNGNDTINYAIGDGMDTVNGGADSDILGRAGANILNVIFKERRSRISKAGRLRASILVAEDHAPVRDHLAKSIPSIVAQCSVEALRDANSLATFVALKKCFN
jgi:hypothetical protein